MFWLDFLVGAIVLVIIEVIIVFFVMMSGQWFIL